MTVLLMRLSGPMQSWGTQSRFTTRDTGLEPSKSGVIGLLCASLGFPRTETELNVSGHTIRLSDLAKLRMGVRVDREGTLARDFHTAGGGTLNGRHDGPRYGVVKASGKAGDTVISTRYYLADAEFLVAVAGDLALLQRLQDALHNPVWPQFLGRKSFVPGKPVCLHDGLRSDADDVESVLRAEPWQRPERHWQPTKRLRLALETDDPFAGEARQDVPLSFDIQNRSFAVRHVRTDWIENLETLPEPADSGNDLVHQSSLQENP